MTTRSPAVGGRSVAASDRVLSRLVAMLPPLAVAVVLLAAWETWGSGQVGTPLSSPSRIIGAFADESGLLLRSGWATFLEALGGLAIGTAFGLLMAFAAARFIVARDILLPIAIGAAAIPLIALAPIFNN